MMGADQYCLKWNYHWANLVGVFNSLLETETFVDVTISCEGHRLRAHRLVLSACSPYFTQLLVDNPDRHPVIILKGVKFDHLKAIIHFIYNGEVAVDQKELPVLISIARELQIRGLADKRLQEAQLQLAATQSLSHKAENAKDGAKGDENNVVLQKTSSADDGRPTASEADNNKDGFAGSQGVHLAGFSCSLSSGGNNAGSQDSKKEENREDDHPKEDAKQHPDTANAGDVGEGVGHTEPLTVTALDQPTDLSSSNNSKERWNASSTFSAVAMPPPSPVTPFTSVSASVSPRSPPPQSGSCSPIRKKRRLSEEHQNGNAAPHSPTILRDDGEVGRRNGDSGVRSLSPEAAQCNEEPLELTVGVSRDGQMQRRLSPVSLASRDADMPARAPSSSQKDEGDMAGCAPSGPSPPGRPSSGLSVTPLPHASPLLPTTPVPPPISRHQLSFIQRALAMGYPPLPYFGAGLDPQSPLPPTVPGLSNQTKDLLQFLDLVKSLGNSDSAGLPAGIAPAFPMPGMVGAAPGGVISPAKEGDAAEYTCHICARIMPSQQFLEEHIKIHEEEKPYKCDHCGQRYKYQSAFQRHQEQNHTAKLPGEKPYRCTVCGQCFKYHKSFLKHRSNHDVLDHIMKSESDESKSSLPPSYIQCLLNSRLSQPPPPTNTHPRPSLDSPRSLQPFKEEMVDVDDSVGEHPPPSTPSASINENGELKEEDDEMDEDNSVWKFIHCLKCKATFRDVASFDAHCRLLASECSSENMREVSVPGGDNSNLSNPHSGSSSPPASPHRSPGWPPSLNSRSPLAGAAASSPQLPGSMLSPSCATTASSSSSSLYSPFTSINFTSLSNKVPVSPSVIAISSGASSLPIIVSAAASVCPASICAPTLGSGSSSVTASGSKLLEEGIQPSPAGGSLAFEEERPFKCPYCTKGFKGRENLKLHIRTHTGEKPYNCGVCGKAFGGRSDMNRHLRIHTGEKPYPCKVCGKKFARADYLSKHITTHLGIPFAKPVHSLQQSLQNLETIQNYQSMQNLPKVNNVQTN